MRIPGWLLGIAVFLALFLGTGICSVTTFSLTQQAVIDLHQTGISVGDAGLIIRCVITGQLPCNPSDAAPSAAKGSAPLLVLTPMLTAVPQESAQASEPAAAVTSALNVVSASTAVSAIATPNALVLANLPQITDPRQIRLLLLGIDQRSSTEDKGPFRSDTMMLMNVDPVRKTVGVLSLPRDLWVPIPGYEQNRINTANFLGDRDAYPGGGGPALAMETVSENFGMRVDRYLLINFDVFTSIVDTLAPNGVAVTVNEYIDDPFYPDAGYGIIHVQFSPGEQRMDAETLLQYARTRATEGGDFDRARRQLQVLDALRAEVLSAGGVFNFISQAPRLWEELSDNYRTNLTLNDILALGRLMGDIERDSIRFEVVDNLYVSTGQSPQGEMVLYPDYASIGDLIQRVFFPPSQMSTAEIQTRAEIENSPIYVFNGTQLLGLASATRDWLVAQGVIVSGVGNLNGNDRILTEIRDYGGRNIWTARYLANLMGLTDERIVRSGDGLIAEGVMVALGNDALPIIDG